MMLDYEIINSDCLKAMKQMPDGCVDAIVTDPPYGLAFMGANWDHNVPSVPYWSECLRVAKSGAHLLCFGGKRTFHRLMCAIEDAGWETRDTIMWVYGSGFPKSMDVGKAIDKALCAKRKETSVRGRSGSKRNCMAGDFAGGEYMNTEPATDQARQWDGWGTCLKPAWEPIIVARKPLDGTVAHNVMEYGTGAINIDGCRVPTHDEWTHAATDSKPLGKNTYGHMERVEQRSNSLGRFPANLVHDGSQEVLELFPDNSGRNSDSPQSHRDGPKNCYGDYGDVRPAISQYDQQGNAARFFYCAKASKRDRGEGNDHPTVKPNALMRWLVRLVCSQGGTVLDPFMGSGSTGVACMQEGMRFVGIDMDEHYCEIANTRISRDTDRVFCESR